MHTYKKNRVKYINLTFVIILAILGTIFMIPLVQDSSAINCPAEGFLCDTDGDGFLDSCYVCDTDGDGIADSCYSWDTDGDGTNDSCFVCDTDGDGILDSGYLYDTDGDGTNDACCDPSQSTKIPGPNGDAWSYLIPFASSEWGELTQYILNNQISGTLDVEDMLASFALLHLLKCCPDDSTGFYKYESERHVGSGTYSLTGFEDPVNTLIGKVLNAMAPTLIMLGIYDEVKAAIENNIPSATGLSATLGAGVNDWVTKEKDDCFCPEISRCETGVRKAWATATAGIVNVPIPLINGFLSLKLLEVRGELTWRGSRIGKENVTKKYGSGGVLTQYRLPADSNWVEVWIVDPHSWPDPPMTSTNILCM